MLTYLQIANIALIDELKIEFGTGLNLLTGETGSGKSIIIDSLGALTGERISADLIKEGQASAQIQGVFSVSGKTEFRRMLSDGGVQVDDNAEIELIVRRELSRSGKNRIFVNDHLVTQAFLKSVGEFLADIHGQGEQASLFRASTHLELLDDFASMSKIRGAVAVAHDAWLSAKKRLQTLEQDEADKLQLFDILKFQIDEIAAAALQPDELDALEEAKRRLNNVEKLTSLSEEAYKLLYENDESTVATLDRAARRIEELAEFDGRFEDHRDGIVSARAVIEDLAITARDFRHHLEFSPERLAEIDDRLAEIARVTRKYGGTVASALEHFEDARLRFETIETAELRRIELRTIIADHKSEFVQKAAELSEKRRLFAGKFEKDVSANLQAVALEKAVFEVRIESPSSARHWDEDAEKTFSPKGFDRVEFYFSANPGESPKQLSRVASGGEASRLMLVLKTTARSGRTEKSAVFDEIDSGIGGRVAESVGRKLKQLSASQQVLCVTHQPQIASLADRHFVIEKRAGKKQTEISVRELDGDERVEEIARMLAGETITTAARQNARDMMGLHDAANPHRVS